MKAQALVIHLPSTRGVTLSPYGGGNLKIGLGVLTYDRLPGHPSKPALGAGHYFEERGTCPGATAECQAICYAARPVTEAGPVRTMWEDNSDSDIVPPIPEYCTKLRIHVSGDFNTPEYIWSWIARLQERPDVKVWAYTRSWRVPELVFHLEKLRSLPNMELFASMDASHSDEPPTGWRRAWILRTQERPGFPSEKRLTMYRTPVQVPAVGHEKYVLGDLMTRAYDGTPSYVCPEETGRKANCESCRYCFDGHKHDVTFLEH